MLMRVIRGLLDGFRDPVTRPRFIIWGFVGVLFLAMFMVVALGATSTQWFCRNGCHKVQDDTIAAYDKGAHSHIACVACHEPANANTVVFMLKKVSALGELYQVLTNTYHLPLNKGSVVSLNEEEMGSGQCTQCHSPQRQITPHKGLIINHQKHAAAGVWCTVCHNRTAHNDEAAQPVLTDPYGHKNTVHPNYMDMEACFRCHDQEGTVKMVGKEAKAAPGTCSACHTKDFNLLPESHKAATWSGKGHSSAAMEALAKVASETVEAKERVKDGAPAYLVAPVNECSMCHKKDFCTSCHGVEMPHPQTFVKNHKAFAQKNLTTCLKCHGAGAPEGAPAGSPLIVPGGTQPQFCDDCHHKGKDASKTWLQDHPRIAAQNGATQCFTCHSPLACAKCHVRGGTGPISE